MVSERQLQLVAVVEDLRAGDDLQHAARQLLAHRGVGRGEVLQRLADDVLLVLDLLVVGQVLPHAAAARAEVRALGHGLVLGPHDDLVHLGLGEGVLALGDDGVHLLARDGARHEHGHAVQRGETRAAMGELLDGQHVLLARLDTGRSGGS
jgi:hypothetical protein